VELNGEGARELPLMDLPLRAGLNRLRLYELNGAAQEITLDVP